MNTGETAGLVLSGVSLGVHAAGAVLRSARQVGGSGHAPHHDRRRRTGRIGAGHRTAGARLRGPSGAESERSRDLKQSHFSSPAYFFGLLFCLRVASGTLMTDANAVVCASTSSRFGIGSILRHRHRDSRVGRMDLHSMDIAFTAFDVSRWQSSEPSMEPKLKPRPGIGPGWA